MDGEIGKAAGVVIAHSFKEESVGKSWAVTKKWFSWRFSLNGEVHAVDFTMSRFSGRKKLIVNGRLEHEERSMFKMQAFKHTWEQSGQSMTVAEVTRGRARTSSTFDELGSEQGGSRVRYGLWIADKSFDEYEMIPLPASAVTKVTVKIRGARGLRKADWRGLSDPYCVCEITNKRGSKFQTSVIGRTLNPDWEHEEIVPEYIPGDSITFTVYDKDKWLKKDDVLGTATLKDWQFYPYGFHGEVELSSGGKGVFPTLQLTVLVSNTPQERELREIFSRCDQDGDGKLNKRELIKVLRADKDIADFFELPQTIRQEDGSRDEMERIFQAVDTNGDRVISWDEFKTYFASRYDRGGACERRGAPRAASHSPTQSSAGRRNTWQTSTPESRAATARGPPDLSLPMLEAPPSAASHRSRRRERAASVPHIPAESRRGSRKKPADPNKEPADFFGASTGFGFEGGGFGTGGFGAAGGLHGSFAELAGGAGFPPSEELNFAGGDSAWPDQGWPSMPPQGADPTRDWNALGAESAMPPGHVSQAKCASDPWQPASQASPFGEGPAEAYVAPWTPLPNGNGFPRELQQTTDTEARVRSGALGGHAPVGTSTDHAREIDPWVNLPPSPLVATAAGTEVAAPSGTPATSPMPVQALPRPGSAAQLPPWDMGPARGVSEHCVGSSVERPLVPSCSPVDIERFWEELDNTLQVPTPVPKHPWAAAPPLQSPIPQHLAPPQSMQSPILLPASPGMPSLLPNGLPVVPPPMERSPALAHAYPLGGYPPPNTGRNWPDPLTNAVHSQRDPWCT